MTPATETKPRPRIKREEARARIVDSAVELVRERSFAELTVGELMDRAGLERTIFYRHFENVGELLLSSGRQAIEELFAAQAQLAATRADHGPASVREAMEVCVRIYSQNGPLLRAVSEAVATNQLVAVDQDEIRRRFDGLVAEALRSAAADGAVLVADPLETAHALNLLNERYLLDTFGREPRVSVEQATQTLTEIWSSLLGYGGGG